MLLYLLREILKIILMAKVLFSALISDMRNKLNGSVFAKNRGGSYLRTKVTPVNPQTVAQVHKRQHGAGNLRGGNRALSGSARVRRRDRLAV